MDKLPLEIVKHIISYDKRFIIRNGKIIQIHQIQKNDKKYEPILGIKIKNYDIENNSSCVYLTVNSYKDICLMYSDNKVEFNFL
jgi:hypothetical protein